LGDGRAKESRIHGPQSQLPARLGQAVSAPPFALPNQRRADYIPIIVAIVSELARQTMPGTSKSQDWLALFLYGLDVLGNPSPAKLVGFFDSWNYHHCLRPQLKRLERLRLLERRERGSTAPCRLTELGRIAGLDVK
jgi:hypothetical protein